MEYAVFDEHVVYGDLSSNNDCSAKMGTRYTEAY